MVGRSGVVVTGEERKRGKTVSDIVYLFDPNSTVAINILEFSPPSPFLSAFS